jgi:hypothetical protein
MELYQLDTDTLHHFLMEETKTFTAALRDGASSERLRGIRNRVQELLKILNDRKRQENKTDQSSTEWSSNSPPSEA